jgi:hypothetical protein
LITGQAEHAAKNSIPNLRSWVDVQENKQEWALQKELDMEILDKRSFLDSESVISIKLNVVT